MAHHICALSSSAAGHHLFSTNTSAVVALSGSHVSFLSRRELGKVRLLISGSCSPHDLLEASPLVPNLLPRPHMPQSAHLLGSEAPWDLSGKCGLRSVLC
jgi:hypothetical protein